jgi:uncharacterized membrane protein YbjE (DUF340 family)
MKSSFIIVGFFVMGVLLAMNIDLPDFLTDDKPTMIILYILLFLVGLGLGIDEHLVSILKSFDFRVALVPLSVLIGTYIGSILFSLFLPSIHWIDSLAIGSGFGYYSLSSVLISEYAGEKLGVIALIANISREVLTLLLAPLMAKYFGKLAPIASGGATSMDTTLPVIVRFSGKEFTLISIFNGVVLSILVPILISIIYKF